MHRWSQISVFSTFHFDMILINLKLLLRCLLQAVNCAHVSSVACPYKELTRHFCMQIWAYENTREGEPKWEHCPCKNPFSGVHESGGDLFWRLPSEVRKKTFEKTPENVQCFSEFIFYLISESNRESLWDQPVFSDTSAQSLESYIFSQSVNNNSQSK